MEVTQSPTTTKGRPSIVCDEEVRIAQAWYKYKNETSRNLEVNDHEGSATHNIKTVKDI